MRLGNKLIFRVAALALLALTVWWAIVVYRGENEASGLGRLADRILLSEGIPVASLQPVLKYLDRTEGQRAGCRTRALGSSGVIRQYAAALSEGETRKKLLESARADIRGYLACSPHEAVFWYELFWLEQALGSAPAETLRFLEMSYVLGPREGRIAQFRLEDAIPHYDELPPSFQARVQEEFLYLVRDSVWIAAAILAASPAPARTRYLDWLAQVPLEKRKVIASLVDQREVLIEVPGVEYREGRVVR